jgi:hypothetical protein
MSEPQEIWLQRQAIELLAQHIPFETDLRVKAECIEELRALVLRAGRAISWRTFGFEARQELQRLNLWHYFTDVALETDDDSTYGHGHFFSEDDDDADR